MPRQVESRLAYFTDKVNNVEKARDVNSSTANVARAELYRRSRLGTWRLVSCWNLVNEVSPVTALVANNGTVVTFDNWHSMGYGADVVAIYHSDGTLVRKFGLEEFVAPDDIVQLDRSVSSIWWSGKHRIEEAPRELVLQVRGREIDNAKGQLEIEEVRVNLDSGVILTPKRAIFPRPRVTWKAEDAILSNCGRAHALSGRELEQQVVLHDVPEYPRVARMARIAGTIVLDIVIDDSGRVGRVSSVKALPFGIDEAARTAVGKWQFRSAVAGDGNAERCGRVAMTFDLTHL
jgi:TonB family protein